MPYIAQNWRDELDPALNALIKQLAITGAKAGAEGCANYIITRLLLSLVVTPSYKVWNAIIGVLECCKLELYARRVRPYEQGAVERNGDVDG